MNRRHRRWLTGSVLIAGGLLGGVAAAVSSQRAGLGCVHPPCVNPDRVVSVVGGSVLGVAVAGLPYLIRALVATPARERRILVAWCVVSGGGFVAVLAVLSTIVGAFLIAAGCLMTLGISTLLLSEHRALVAAGMALAVGCGAWLVTQEPFSGLFLAPAILFWAAAGFTGLLEIRSDPGRGVVPRHRAV